jgi:OPA family glycerol-3-phosphate transporter-like MFS transporter
MPGGHAAAGFVGRGVDEAQCVSESIYDDADRLRRWRALTLGLLAVGYSGYYLCRSNFSVALPLITQELESRGMSRDVARLNLGMIATAGTLAYALGKPFAGGLADFFGGRRNFLVGMAGAVVCTLAFAAGGSMPFLLTAWSGNRLVQSLGWAGMVKMASRWCAPSTYGTAMAILSLSFLFGDAAARGVLGLLIGYGVDWRGVFAFAACTLIGLFVLNARLLKETPAMLGLHEPPADLTGLYGAAGADPTPPGIGALLGPLLRSPAFGLVCLLSLGLTLLREASNTWTPTYFVEGIGLRAGDAASLSGLLPLAGGISVLLAGHLGDRLGRQGRAAIIVIGLALAGLALAALGLGDFAGSTSLPVALAVAASFLMIGPYSYLAGAISLDFGGKRGGATASGLIDAVGYIGGALAGVGTARLAASTGWRGVFVVLAVVAWLSSAVAAAFLVEQRRTSAVAQSGVDR